MADVFLLNHGNFQRNVRALSPCFCHHLIPKQTTALKSLAYIYHYHHAKFAVITMSNYPRASLGETAFNYSPYHGMEIGQHSLSSSCAFQVTLFDSIKSKQHA